MKIVLYSPDIPQNVGNIARTCAVTGTELTLVRPLGFNLSTKQLKRAGLDYLEDVKMNVVDSLEDALSNPFYFFSTKGKKLYTEICFDELAMSRNRAPSEGSEAIHANTNQNPYLKKNPEALQGRVLQSACLIFGSESAGLPQWVHEKWPTHFYTIPMCPGLRSLNLSNAVAIVLYEALRQKNFIMLQRPSSSKLPDL